MRRKRYMARIVHVFYIGQDKDDGAEVIGSVKVNLREGNVMTPQCTDFITEEIKKIENLSDATITNYIFMN